MKKLILIVAMVLGMATMAQADLEYRGNGSYNGSEYKLIYDTVKDITWLDYTNDQASWSDQMTWAANLSVTFNGQAFDDWRLPATVDGDYIQQPNTGFVGAPTGQYYVTTNELGYLFYVALGNDGRFFENGIQNIHDTHVLLAGPFDNLLSAEDQSYYWNGEDYLSNTGRAWNFYFYHGMQSTMPQNTNYFALAVRSGDVAGVPEPATMLLLGLGLVGLAGIRKRMGM